MLYKEYISIKSIALHKVGNKLNQDEIVFSKSLLSLDESLQKILLNYFLSAFNYDELYHFYHDASLSLNEVYTFVTNIFENQELLYQESKNIAQSLYNESVHPKIKYGEFYTVYFKDCIFNGETIDAIGLFKSENKDTFLEIDDFDIESKLGVNVNKLDKGCLIFNTQKENGYKIAIVDNTNRGNEAQYWKDNFLKLRPCSDEYHHTKDFLNITKNFITKQIHNEFEVSKADQIDLLNKTVEYFKNHDNFNKQQFEDEVFEDNAVIESFRNFDQSYRDEHKINLSNDFEISTQAVKKQSRVLKNVLKLDKNFHIYIHGNRNLIEQGIDENGRKFYKIFYEEEN